MHTTSGWMEVRFVCQPLASEVPSSGRARQRKACLLRVDELGCSDSIDSAWPCAGWGFECGPRVYVLCRVSALETWVGKGGKGEGKEEKSVLLR